MHSTKNKILGTAVFVILLTAIIGLVATFMAAPNPQSAILNSQSNQSLLTSVARQIPPPERKVSFTAQQMPLKDALAEVCRAADVELELDAAGLKSGGLTTDLPITVTFKDEPLDYAVGRILNVLDRQGFHDIYQEMRGENLIVGSILAQQARMSPYLPDWLKLGLAAKLDDDRNVISISVGENADDLFLAKLKTLPKLRELDIEGTKLITPAGLAHLAELPALEKLNLYEMSHDGEGLGNDALPIISQIKSLRALRISYCSLTDVGLHALEGMTQLTALNFSHNRLTDAGMKSLADLTNLQSLDVSDFPSTMSDMQITDEGLKQLSPLKELRELSIGGLKISGKTLAFPHLQSLSLSGDLVTDAALDGIMVCRDLRQLSLQYAQISDEGLKRIASLKELRRLNLDSRVITDAGIAHLTALPNLEHLELRATQISDESLKHLSQIKSLTRLDLHGSGVGGVNYGRLFTIQGLQQLKNLPQLRELWINNFESSNGFMGLSELKQIFSLTLFFTNISDEEAKQLEAAMPDTTISADSGRRRFTVEK